jgi:hypothetical protein
VESEASCLFRNLRTLVEFWTIQYNVLLVIVTKEDYKMA